MSAKFKSLELNPSVPSELAKEIESVDAQMVGINGSRLREATLIGLLAADSGVSMRSVKKVLDALANLRKKHLK